ncbi:MAG: AmmeMemoRadiSam system protein B [Spirochaetes bacterium]|nr:AmmeMemoRadiSam system protein B [Spirochaetota bacterium]
MESLSLLKARPKEGNIREAVVAGIFYPAVKTELTAVVEELVASCNNAPASSSVILSPHGSLEYSGRMEAAAWLSASLRKVKTIVVICPSHRSFETGIFIPESRVFSVPTADFRVNSPILKDLLHSSAGIIQYDIPHLEEHSIEIQLIMAALFFPRATIVPIIVSKVDPETVDALFAALARALERDFASTLLVLSSNLAVAESPEACDAESLSFLSALCSGNLSQYPALPEDRRSFCGADILGAFLRSTLSRGLKASVLGLSNSAPFGEEGDPIVGYSAVGFSS